MKKKSFTLPAALTLDEFEGEYWRRQWHPTPVLLPGKSHGRRSLLGGSPWGRTESDTTEWLHFHFSLSCIGEGNGNPLQCSCLENPRDGEAWWAAVYGVAQSWTRLKWLSSSNVCIIGVSEGGERKKEEGEITAENFLKLERNRHPGLGITVPNKMNLNRCIPRHTIIKMLKIERLKAAREKQLVNYRK